MLVDGLEEVSAASRYHRFHASRDSLAEAELDFLTHCDGHNHIALLAIQTDSQHAETKGVGVARCIRQSDSQTWGEVAIIVIDEWQRRGVGTALLAALAVRCRQEGVTKWRAEIMGENRPALKLFDKSGKIVRRSWDHRCITLEIALDSA